MDIDWKVPTIQVGDIPREVLNDIGKAIVRAHNARIRDTHQTVQGDQLDPNGPGWRDAKAFGTTPELAISDYPLVYTGAMTELESWDISIGDDVIEASLRGAGLEHANSVIDQSREKSNNWEEAFGVGPFEKAAAMAVLKKWIFKNPETLFRFGKSG